MRVPSRCSRVWPRAKGVVHRGPRLGALLDVLVRNGLESPQRAGGAVSSFWEPRPTKGPSSLLMTKHSLRTYRSLLEIRWRE